MHLDQLHRLTYAVDVIKIVSALHRMNYAWMDIKPHNFVTVRNEHNLLRVLGIDLDLARELDSNLPPNYNQVTWEYASPEIAFRHPRTGYIASTSERQLSTPEQYDIWSLGVTVLEILDDGNSFCSRIGGDIPAIQSKLRSLTDETVARHIHARFVGNNLQTRAIRSFLLTALKVNPAERPRACELIEVIQGSKITGLTATNKLIRDGFQRQEENFSELREMLTKLQHSLSVFQFELTNSVNTIIQTLQSNATGSELAHHANEFTNVSNGIGQLANSVENAVNAQEVERIFKNQFQNLVTGFLSSALGEAQENMNRSVAAALQQQQSFILEHFKNFTAIQEVGAKCNEKQFADLRTEISAKMGSLHEDFQEVSCKLSQLSATVHRLEESQNRTHLLLVKLYTSETQYNAHSKQMLHSLFTTLNGAVESIKSIGDTDPAKLESIIASVCSQFTDSRVHRPLSTAEKTVFAVKKTIASGLVVQDKSDLEEMRAIARTIAEMRNDMQSLAIQNKAMHEDIRFVRQEFAKHSAMLQTILTGESRVPTLMVVLPKDSSSIRGSLKRLFTDVMHIHFVCPITLRFGLPYKLTIPKGWVTKVAPVIKMSLVILKVALMCAGLPIPIPIPNLPTEDFSKLLSTLETSLNANIEGNTSVMNVLNEIDFAMSDVAAMNAHNAVHLRKLSLQQKRLSTLTKSSYAEVYTLLHKLETGSLGNADWTPKCTGLVRVTSQCDGTTAWVLNDSTVMDEFHAKGKDSMQVI